MDIQQVMIVRSCQTNNLQMSSALNWTHYHPLLIGWLGFPQQIIMPLIDPFNTTPAGPTSINHHFEDKSCIRIISPCHNHQTKELYQWIGLKKIEPGKPWCLAPTWIFGFQMFPWLNQFWYVLRAWLNWDLLRFQRCDGIWILQACIHGLLTRLTHQRLGRMCVAAITQKSSKITVLNS